MIDMATNNGAIYGQNGVATLLMEVGCGMTVHLFVTVVSSTPCPVTGCPRFCYRLRLRHRYLVEYKLTYIDSCHLQRETWPLYDGKSLCHFLYCRQDLSNLEIFSSILEYFEGFISEIENSIRFPISMDSGVFFSFLFAE